MFYILSFFIFEIFATNLPTTREMYNSIFVCKYDEDQQKYENDVYEALLVCKDCLEMFESNNTTIIDTQTFHNLLEKRKINDIIHFIDLCKRKSIHKKEIVEKMQILQNYICY